jgi:dolichyl-diphosphooligosaccharide--protein glycosyltransferase
MQGLSAWPWLSVVGILGFIILVVQRPVALLLAPLLGLSMMAPQMGYRVMMFGGPVVALGMFWTSTWPPRIMPRHGKIAAFILIAFAAAQLFVLGQRYQAEPPVPIMSRAQAEAMVTLKDIADPGSTVWGWWDWGYAAQYFTGLDTFADGAKHSGRYLWPLGVVMGGDDPSVSAETIRRETPGSAYLVVTWDAVMLMPWISYYGHWDSKRGTSSRSRIGVIPGRFEVDIRNGQLIKEGVPPVPISSMLILSQDKAEVHEISTDGPELVVNELTGQALLMANDAYRAMAMQMLWCSANDHEISQHFRLVYEGAPLVRIWKLKED